MTSTHSTKFAIRYDAVYAVDALERRTGALPSSVRRLDDGRVVATYDTPRRTAIFGDWLEFGAVHPHSSRQADKGLEPYDAPPLPATYAVTIDWAELHHLACEIDRARRGSNLGVAPGHGGCVDAFGGTYTASTTTGLLGALRLVGATETIARDAWDRVFHARKRGTGIDDVRQACCVAIACSRMFAALHRAGLVDDPARRICGTGDGYGLSGLRALAGAAVDRGCTSQEIERFAAGGPLPGKD